MKADRDVYGSGKQLNDFEAYVAGITGKEVRFEQRACDLHR